jgi:hypothetical protein
MSLPALALPDPEPRRDPRPGPRSGVLRVCPEHPAHPAPTEPEQEPGPVPPERGSPLRRHLRLLRHRLTALLRAAAARLTAEDRGMSTVEYAIGTLAAAAFAAVLYTVISGDSIVTALTQLVQRALSVTF